MDDEVVALTKVETQFLTGRFVFDSSGKADVFQTVTGTKYSLSADSKKVANGLNIMRNDAGNGSIRGDSANNNYVDVDAIATGTALKAVFLNGEDISTWYDSDSNSYIYY
ncbi:MAG: hypothetical protein LBB57_01885, partial [Clostridiales Family XIII bacterium]|nr:hypothetical protein [Clostridiales Family XIII bacterium]